MSVFNNKTQFISERIESAIKTYEKKAARKRKDTQKHAVDTLSKRIDEIADSIIENIELAGNKRAISKSFYITDLFSIKKDDITDFILAIYKNADNDFANYLIANKLTMARDIYKGNKVVFAYGDRACFRYGWHEICGIDFG